MSIFKTAYDTTVGKSFVMSKVDNGLREAIIKDYIENNNYDIQKIGDLSPILITNRDKSEANIPYFSHPYLLEMKESRDHKTDYLCSDVRSYVTYTQSVNPENNLHIRNKMEFDLAKIRLILNMIWLSDRPRTLRDISPVPLIVFCSWISEGVSRRFALDPRDQLNLSIIAGIYYFSLFNESDTFTEDDVLRVTGAVIKATKAPSKDVISIFDRVEKLGNVKDFCATVRNILENPRLDDFNEGLLISILSGSWFGTNAKEMLAISLEHPPTWIAVVYSSLVERSFKNSVIAKISDRYALAKGGNDFTRSLISVIKSHTEND